MHLLDEELFQLLIIFLFPSWLHDLISDMMEILCPYSLHVWPKSLNWIQRAWIYRKKHLLEVLVIDLIQLLAVVNRMIIKNYQYLHSLTLALQRFHEVHENFSVIVILEDFIINKPSFHAYCTNDMDRWSYSFDHIQLHSWLQPASISFVPHMQAWFIDVENLIILLVGHHLCELLDEYKLLLLEFLILSKVAIVLVVWFFELHSIP